MGHKARTAAELARKREARSLRPFREASRASVLLLRAPASPFTVWKGSIVWNRKRRTFVGIAGDGRRVLSEDGVTWHVVLT